jgi:LuxR family transcriptional regulator, maltose regulon positive regulatory protein
MASTAVLGRGTTEANIGLQRVLPGSVSRTALVNRLRGARGASVVSIAAPAGYGKTTLLAQWASRERRAFASVSLRTCGSDLQTMLECIGAALDRVGSLDSSRGNGLARLAAALSESSAPLVLALDDVGVARSKECEQALAVLADHVPSGSCLALAGRYAPPPLVARARARGLLFELGPDELALTPSEARLLLEAEGIELGPEAELELLRKTEGWAAGVYLAALSFHDGDRSPDSLEGFGGDDRFVADYLRFECLSALRPKELRFLTRSSVLERLSSPFCDAVLGQRDSAQMLSALERKRIFLVPLDRRREWFRYHRIFRELLRAELERDEPELVPELNRRAAEWCETNDFLAEAIDHAQAARDRGRMARLVSVAATPSVCGSSANADRWFGRLDDPAILTEHPAIAVFGSLHHALLGRPLVARRWADAAENAKRRAPLPDRGASVEPWLHILRATRCQQGVAVMRADAEAALDELPYDSAWTAFALVTLGAAQLIGGNDEDADATFAEASTSAAALGDEQSHMVAVAERSLLAADRGDFDTARRLAHEARTVAEEFELQSHTTSTIAIAAAARVALNEGDSRRVRTVLDEAGALVPLLTYAIPWLSTQTLLELARTRLALGQLDLGRTLLGRAEEIIRRSVDLGILEGLAARLETRAPAPVGLPAEARTELTPAELRLLPYLATHLSFPEIGRELSLSRNTIKTQAVAIYRKLGVTSRSEAIARVAELGFVDDPRPAARHRR